MNNERAIGYSKFNLGGVMKSKVFFVLLVLCLSVTNIFAQDFNKQEFAARRAKLAEKIPDGIAIIFANREHVHPAHFRQSPDFFYFTGVEESDAVLVINGMSKTSAVFAGNRSEIKVMIEGPGLRNEEKAAEKYGFGVLPLESFYTYMLFMTGNAKKMYLPTGAQDELQKARDEILEGEMSGMSHPVFGGISEMRRGINKLREMFPNLEVEDVTPMIDDLRWVKSAYEIDRLRKSGKIGAEGFKEAMKGTKPGMYEYEIEAAAHYVYRKNGAREAFTPIVASGPNTITWHYGDNNRQMQDGDIVLMDYGCDYDYYTSDITRTWPVSGKFTAEQEKMYQCILEASKAIIAKMKPGVSIKELKDAAQVAYKKYGYENEFLALGRYIGHFIGISVHDVKNATDDVILKAGVVLNVEPIIEFRDKKIHMRLEDTILVTETGSENLTAGIPAELDQVYALIKQKRMN